MFSDTDANYSNITKSAPASSDSRRSMTVLIAEDDAGTRHLLSELLTLWGFRVETAENGNDAWQILAKDNPPQLVVLDWLMPGLDGLEVCRKVREVHGPLPPYIILLTVKKDRADIVKGLQTGIDDYITKPFDNDELAARLQIGARVVEMQRKLIKRNRELEDSLSHVKQLQGILPICAWCKKVRDDKNYWRQVEEYISKHSEARFSHSICPDCRKKMCPEIDELAQPGKNSEAKGNMLSDKSP